MKELPGPLNEWMSAEDPFDYSLRDVEPIQVELANHRFQQMRGQIDALDHVAKVTDVDAIVSAGDLVPVLLSHESYKSYPEALVRQGRWSYLSAWLSRLTTVQGLTDVDTSSVSSIDEWLECLRGAGISVFGSSGTSGKSSLFAISDTDRETALALHLLDFAWGPQLEPGADVRLFLLMPRRGFYRGCDDVPRWAQEFANSHDTYWMSTEPLLLTDVNRMGELRQAIAAGTAKPSDLTEFETAAAEKSDRVTQDLEHLVDALVARRNERAVVWGGWAQQFRLVEILRARGFDDGFLHPDSVVHIAGGKKGVDLPDDFEARIRSFWGIDPSRYLLRYGCSEIVGLHPACSAGNYHIGPWVMPLVLDKAGETLVSNGQPCEGRMAFMDLSSDGRWGGVITGDRVSFNPKACACGRRGPSVENITRYADLEEGEDKLSCAGTIEAYVRGEMLQ